MVNEPNMTISVTSNIQMDEYRERLAAIREAMNDDINADAASNARMTWDDIARADVGSSPIARFFSNRFSAATVEWHQPHGPGQAAHPYWTRVSFIPDTHFSDWPTEPEEPEPFVETESLW